MEPWALVKRTLAVWAATTTAGGVVLAVPDTGPRVLSLSETHGPSLVDSVGILILVAGWLPVPVLLYRSRGLVPSQVWVAAGCTALVGTLALAVTIRRDLGWWWVPSAAALATAQAMPLVALARPRPPEVATRRPATPRGGAG